MSRIGNRKLTIPEGVTVSFNDGIVTVKGAKGELTLPVSPLVKVVVEGNEITTEKVKDTKEANILSGTTNSNINNMLIGVSTGNKIVVSAGYSHTIDVVVPSGITVTSPSNTELSISGFDKQKVSEFAANIRKIREPEPYKGKGIRYKGEYIRRKEGKKAAK